MAAPFVLRTLGVPQLATATGEVVRFRTRKHFALAIRLAVEPGRPLTRDHLFELLWSDAPDHRGRHSLAQAITVLRTKLGREALSVHKATIALVPGVVDADVLHLDDCDTAISGGFLEGFEIPHVRPFEDWRDAWHAGLLPKIRDCLVKQMDAGRRVGDFEKVERHANVLRALEPLSEDALRGVMEARAWVGDRTNALKAFAEFERRLASELGAKPHQDLVRIAHLLREGRRSPYHQSRDAARQEGQEEGGEKRFEPEHLVGRDREFGRLYDAWRGVRRRLPSIVVMLGDPGVGKTTLTNAFASSCQIEGAIVARAQAYEAESQVPFVVLSELVRQLTVQRVVGSAEPDALSELSRICSEVLTTFPGVDRPLALSADVAPLRLADAFHKTVTAVAEQAPLVLIIDDLHAADSASAAILHMVARKVASTRVLVILVARTNDLRSAEVPFRLATDAFTRRVLIELEPLSGDSAKRLARTLAADLDENALARVLAASTGYPLAIDLLVREWRADGPNSLLSAMQRLDALPSVSVGIPSAIRTVFERQVSRLDSHTRSTLDLAAVLGRRLADVSLYSVIGLSPTQAADSLARLCAEGLLREVQGELEFRNELIRVQAYYGVAALARQQMHRQVAEAVEQTLNARDHAALIHVAWHALRGADWKRAGRVSIPAARAALAHGAPREADQLLTALLSTPARPDNDWDTKLLLANALLEQSKADAAVPILEELQSREGLTVGQKSTIARMQAAASYLTSSSPRYLAAAEEAVRLSRRAGDLDLHVQALFEYARSGIEAGDPQRVQTALRDLGQIRATNTGPCAFLLYALAYCHFFLNRIAEAVDLLSQSIATLAFPEDGVLLSQAFNGLGNSLQQMCDLTASSEAFLRGLRIAEQIGDDSRAALVTANLCAGAVIQGEAEEAVRLAERAVELGTCALSNPNMGLIYTNAAAACLLAGNRDEMNEYNRKAREWLGKIPGWRTSIAVLQESTFNELCLGNVEQALQLISQTHELARGRESAVPEPGVFCRLAAFRAAHLENDQRAHEIVAAGLRALETNPLAHVEVRVAEAWLENRGRKDNGALKGLVRFCLDRGLKGRLRLFVAQGFLPSSHSIPVRAIVHH